MILSVLQLWYILEATILFQVGTVVLVVLLSPLLITFIIRRRMRGRRREFEARVFWEDGVVKPNRMTLREIDEVLDDGGKKELMKFRYVAKIKDVIFALPNTNYFVPDFSWDRGR